MKRPWKSLGLTPPTIKDSGMTDKPVDKRAELLCFIVDAKEYALDMKLDKATVKALKADIDRLPILRVDELLEHYKPKPRYVW
jgi:hypothetical protein